MEKHYTPHDRALPKSLNEPFHTPGYMPVSAALISVADADSGIPNIMPLVGWGFLNRLPLYLGVAVSVKEYNADYYERGTYELLRKTMDFSLNIPTDRIRDLVSKTGRLSRHKDPSVDKFKETGLTPLPGKRIKSPHIAECPINYECQVRSIVNMGSHDLFLGEVVGAFTDGKVETVETDEGYDRILMKREDGSVLSLEWATLVHEVR